MNEANSVPDWYDPNEIWLAQGQKSAPQKQLPENKVFTVINKRTDTTSHSIIGRGGVTAVMDTGADDDDRINWNHSNLFSYVGVPLAGGPYGSANLDQNKVIEAAQRVPLAKYEADEMAEGDWGTPFNAPQYQWWCDARRAMYDVAGKPYRNFGTYGSFSVQNGDPWQYMTGDGSQKQPNDPIFKAALQSQAAARKNATGGNIQYFDLFYNRGMGAIIKHYCDQPDYASRYYNKAFAAEQMALGMGAPRGIPPEKLPYLDWGKLEGLGAENASLHNGFWYEREVGNLGKIRHEEHPQIDFDYQVGCIFMIGFLRCSGYITFDDRIRYGTNPLLTRSGIERPHQWVPGTQQNSPESPEGYPIEPLGWHDAGFFAANLWAQCGRTAGAAWNYCEYKVKGTENWISPTQDHTDILEHASAHGGAYAMGTGLSGRRGRADALYRVKGNALDLAIFDPSWGPLNSETLILRPVPNKEYEVKVNGCRARLFNETL